MLTGTSKQEKLEEDKLEKPRGQHDNRVPTCLLATESFTVSQILDATFDHLVPLAVPRMPASMSGLVTSAVNKFINLNVMEQLGQYRGPVLLYRRDHDEMITTRWD